MAQTSADVVNRALLLMGGDQPLVTGNAPNFDNSISGKNAAKLYAGAVATVAREFGWDFARKTVALAFTGVPAPAPWAFEYFYPAGAVQVWQLIPAGADPNNPLPINWAVANSIVNGNQVKVIHTSAAGLSAVYNNNPTEATWDPLFTEAVVRLLASEFAMANSGKPGTADAMLHSGAAFETLGESRGEN